MASKTKVAQRPKGAAQPDPVAEAAASRLTVRDEGILNKIKAQQEEQRATGKVTKVESLLLMLDGSGSMRGHAWRELHGAVRALVEASSPQTSRVGLAIYSDDADVYCGFSSALDAVLDALPMQPPGGLTAMRQGLSMGLGLAWPTEVRRIVLLSDGEPTDGNPVPVAKKLAKLGVVIDTVGCGRAGLQGEGKLTLEAIAAVTGGRFVPCGRITELRGAFRALESRARGLLGAWKPEDKLR